MLSVIVLTILNRENAEVRDKILIGVYDEEHIINGMEALDAYCNKHNIDFYSFSQYDIDLNCDEMISLGYGITEIRRYVKSN